MAKKSTLKTKEEFIHAVNELAQKQVQMDKLKAARDLEIQLVQEKHSEKIEALNDETKELFKDARLFAEDNRSICFPEKDVKTAKTELATYRFFFTPPKIEALSKKFDDERSLLLMHNHVRLAAFVRPKEEIDRESLLAAIAEKNLTAEDLASVGLKHTQTERFEVKPLVESGDRISENL